MFLKDSFKTFTLDQDKIIDPSETVAGFKKKLAGLDLDILRETKRIDNGRLDIPVFFSVYGKDAAIVTGAKKQMGKGATSAQAEASAVMELAERFSFFSFYKNQNRFIYEKYKNIKNRAIPFELIARSVSKGDNWAEAHDFGPEAKIFENLNLRWTKGFNLTCNKEILVPFDWFFALNQFNGASAGNCVEEAVCQGICEVVERDVSARISEKQIPVPLIDPDSVDDLLAYEMINKYRKANIKLYISDFSLDTSIPCIGILAYDPVTFPEKSEIVWTAGVAPDPQKALSRALSETAQLAGDFNTGSNYLASGLPKPKSIKEVGFITDHKTKIYIKSLPNLSNPNIKIEIQNLKKALALKNMEIIVIDTTHSILKIPACYTIIPGACFRERAQNTNMGMFCAKLITENNTPEKALQKLEEIDKITAEKYYIKFYMGLCHTNAGRCETALEFFTQALDLGPNDQDKAGICSYMGVCFKEMGKYKEALKILKKGVIFDNERTDIYNLLGFCYFKLKDHEKAIGCFKEIIKINPSSAIDYANIGSNYREMGDIKNAVSYYETALSIDPTIDFAIENLLRLKGGKNENNYNGGIKKDSKTVSGKDCFKN